MKTIILITVYLFFINGCNAQKDFTTNNDFQIETFPFKIDDTIKIIYLPDSLFEEVVYGKVIFHFFINETGSVDGINLAFLKIYLANGKLIVNHIEPSISFVDAKQYPSEVMPYYSFLIDYAKNRKIVKTKLDSDTRVGSKYLLRLPRKIGYSEGENKQK